MVGMPFFKKKKLRQKKKLVFALRSKVNGRMYIFFCHCICTMTHHRKKKKNNERMTRDEQTRVDVKGKKLFLHR